jgi:hypothetical protein
MGILLGLWQSVNRKRFTVLIESIQYVIIQFAEGCYSVGEGSQFDGTQVYQRLENAFGVKPDASGPRRTSCHFLCFTSNSS